MNVPKIQTITLNNYQLDTIRDHFPIYSTPENKDLIYLDSAATSQRPSQVIQAWEDFNYEYNANTHRGAYKIAEKATIEFEKVRNKIARFIGAASPNEIVFTRGTTESVNMVAQGWAWNQLEKGDEIIITEMEHHSNLIPWQMAALQKGAILKFIKFNDQGELDLDQYETLLTNRTKLVAVTQTSNVLGTIPDVKRIIDGAHLVNAKVLVDGAQSAPHMRVNVRELDADFFVFSGHKMLGPMGTGILYGKAALLEEMQPIMFGGSMISDVDYFESTWNDVPWKFEAGTQNIPGVIGLGAAVDFIDSVGIENIMEHDHELTVYALEQMRLMQDLTIYGPLNHRGPVISFTIKDVHPHDLATFLDSQNMAVRSGHHCAKLIMKRFKIPATARASFYLYNNKQEIDSLVLNLDKARSYFSKWS